MKTKKIKNYLYTSVISALFDDGNPQRQDLNKSFFEKLHQFDVYISDIVQPLILTKLLFYKIRCLKNLQYQFPSFEFSQIKLIFYSNHKMCLLSKDFLM